MTAITSADLLFARDTHTYFRPGGVVVPSVTQILKCTGVSLDFDELSASSPWLAERIEDRRDLGTAVHLDCHAFDDRDLVWASVDPRVRPYVEAWQIFRENLGLVPHTRERMVYHPTLEYCGTLDGIFLRGAHQLILIDLKIGDPDDAGARFQTAAYAMAWEAEHPEARLYERWAVRLIPGRRVPYDIHPYDDYRDRDTWRAIVATFYAQHARRVAA